MSLSSHINEKANLIWAIADKLTGVYKPHEYGEVILPLTVIRRFDCILADTKETVLKKYEEVKELPMRDILLRKASGYQFYNTSKFTFEKLLDDPDNIEANFRDYLNGFSPNVSEIIEKFRFIYLILLKRCIFKAFRLPCVPTLCIFPCFCPYEPKQGKVFYSPPTTLSSSLAEVRFASLVA